MTDPFRLEDETALVTGGTKGIGRAIARSLLAAGASVVICGRDEQAGRAAAEELGVAFVRADVTDEADVADLVGRCVALFGGLSILVNNAGPTELLHSRTVDGPVGAVSLDGWRRVQDSALTSAFLATREVLRPMVAAGRGAIVNISSIAAWQGLPGFDSYAAGKAGLEALTRQVAVGYGHLAIRCNAVRVGSIAVDHERGRPRPAAAPPPASVAADQGDWRFPRPPPAGQPEDVAHAVRYLASAAARYVNGTVLTVDGGMSCRSLLPWQTPRPEVEWTSH